MNQFTFSSFSFSLSALFWLSIRCAVFCASSFMLLST